MVGSSLNQCIRKHGNSEADWVLCWVCVNLWLTSACDLVEVWHQWALCAHRAWNIQACNNILFTKGPLGTMHARTAKLSPMQFTWMHYIILAIQLGKGKGNGFSHTGLLEAAKWWIPVRQTYPTLISRSKEQRATHKSWRMRHDEDHAGGSVRSKPPDPNPSVYL